MGKISNVLASHNLLTFDTVHDGKIRLRIRARKTSTGWSTTVQVASMLTCKFRTLGKRTYDLASSVGKIFLSVYEKKTLSFNSDNGPLWPLSLE